MKRGLRDMPSEESLVNEPEKMILVEKDLWSFLNRDHDSKQLECVFSLRAAVSEGD